MRKLVLFLLLLLPSLVFGAGSTFTGQIGEEDFSVYKDVTTFTRKTSTGATITLHRVGAPDGPLNHWKGAWYVSTAATITDHGDALQTGSLAWVLAQVGATPTTVELPGNHVYTITTPVTVPATVTLRLRRGAVLDRGTTALVINGAWISDEPAWTTGSGTLTLAPAGPLDISSLKVEDLLTKGPVVDLRAYLPVGYVTDGSADYGTQFTAALTAAAALGRVLVVPSGTWHLGTPQVAPAGLRGIVGLGNPLLTFDLEQTGSPPTYLQSLFVLSGVDHFVFRGLRLQYTGTYSPGTDYVSSDPTESYYGYVSGILVEDCDDLLIEDVEATGFNRAGISVAVSVSGVPGEGAQCDRLTVRHCYLHGNKVSGLMLGNVHDALVTGNRLNDNGNVEDSGTGYGLSILSATTGENILVENNLARGNYRKGLDAHAGKGLSFIGNQCIANRYDGISIDNGVDDDDNGAVLVANNLIQDMTADSAVEGVVGHYGIYVGSSSGQGTSQPTTTYTIAGNHILNCTQSGAGQFYPIYVFAHGINKGQIEISNNVVDVGTVEGFLYTSASATTAGTYTDWVVSGNQFHAVTLVSRGVSIASTLARRKVFTNNLVSVDTELTWRTQIVAYGQHSGTSGSSWLASGNIIDATPLYGVWSTSPIMFLGTTADRIIANTARKPGVTSFPQFAPLPDWDGQIMTAQAGVQWGGGTAAPVKGYWNGYSWVERFPKASGQPAGWVSGAAAGYAVKEAWTTGHTYAIGDQVSNGGNIYVAQSDGVAGATAPTHTTGTASDDTVTWAFLTTGSAVTWTAAANL